MEKQSPTYPSVNNTKPLQQNNSSATSARPSTSAGSSQDAGTSRNTYEADIFELDAFLPRLNAGPATSPSPAPARLRKSRFDDIGTPTNAHDFNQFLSSLTHGNINPPSANLYAPTSSRITVSDSAALSTT
jgi:hypothetical protein